MKTQQIIYVIALVLVLVGALNWGLVAMDSSYNVVEMSVGSDNAKYVYYVVGAAALFVAFCNFKHFKNLM